MSRGASRACQPRSGRSSQHQARRKSTRPERRRDCTANELSPGAFELYIGRGSPVPRGLGRVDSLSQLASPERGSMSPLLIRMGYPALGDRSRSLTSLIEGPPTHRMLVTRLRLGEPFSSLGACVAAGRPLNAEAPRDVLVLGPPLVDIGRPTFLRGRESRNSGLMIFINHESRTYRDDRKALHEVLDGQIREYPNGALGELRPKVSLPSPKRRGGHRGVGPRRALEDGRVRDNRTGPPPRGPLHSEAVRGGCPVVVCRNRATP